MKSIQVLHTKYVSEEDKARYSELQVLRSPAGYFIGTTFHSKEGFYEPGSRDTNYFQFKMQADLAFEHLLRINALPEFKGHPIERLIQNWEEYMFNQHNLECYYRYNP